MKRITFKSVCEKLAANVNVKVCTVFGWIVCKASSIEIDFQKKMISVPFVDKYCGETAMKIRMNMILSIEAVA